MKTYCGQMLRRMLMIVLALVMLIAPVSASAVSAWINSSSAVIYASNGASGKLPKGTTVNVTSVSGSWAKISYRGVAGITKLKNVTLKTGMTGYAKTNTPLYKGASLSSGKKGTIPKGTKLKVVGINGNYYQVTDTSYSIVGYVVGSTVSKTKPATVSASKNTSSKNTSSTKKPSTSASSSTAASIAKLSKAEKVALLAKMQEGKPYAFGAEGPNKFDCSGLVYYCFKTIGGVTLKRSSYDMGNDTRFTKIKSISSLRKGDLVCFNTGDGSYVNHVGIYIGSGKFAHCSSTKSKVMISDIDSGFYKEHFLWARRIV